VTGKDEVRIEGVAILDYIALYKKFGGTQASYKLDYIAQKELGKGKVDYGEYANIKEFYLGNPTKFVRYNVNDVALIDELEEKKRYLLLVYTLQYDAKCNTQDAMGQVKLWDSYIFNYCRAHDIIIPPHSKEMPKEIEGAFVLEPKIGLSKWVVSFDLSSLYPSLIQQYNMGYDTIVRHNQKRKGLLEDMIANKPIPEVEEAHNIGCSIAANGTLYRNDKIAVASICVKEMFDSRQDYRKRLKKLLIEIEELHHRQESAKHLEKDTPMLDAFQLAKKVAINAYYGAQANEAFRYYNPDIAEAITLSGQMTIRFIGDKVCKYLDELFETDTGHERWPGGDTDSVDGKSIINTNKGDMTIESIYAANKGNIIEVRGEDNFICKVDGLSALSLNIDTGKTEMRPVEYVMAHKVKKKLYKIKSGGKEVIVTEDHSIMVSRNGNIIPVSPKELQEHDMIIKV